MIDRRRGSRASTASILLLPLLSLALVGATCESPSTPALREQLVENDMALRDEAARTYDGLIAILEIAQQKDEAAREHALAQCRARAASDAEKYANLAWARERKVLLDFERLAWAALTAELGAAFDDRVRSRVEPVMKAEEGELRRVEQQRRAHELDPVLANEQIRLVQSLSKANTGLLGAELRYRDELVEGIDAARGEFRTRVHRDFDEIRAEIRETSKNGCTVEAEPAPLTDAISQIEADQVKAMQLFDEQIRGHAALAEDASKRSPVALAFDGSVEAVGKELGKTPFAGEKLEQAVETKGKELSERIESRTSSLVNDARSRIDGLIEAFDAKLAGKVAELVGS